MSIWPFPGMRTIPMVHLTATVERLLAANRQSDHEAFFMETMAITQAVDACGIYGFYNILNDQSCRDVG